VKLLVYSVYADDYWATETTSALAACQQCFPKQHYREYMRGERSCRWYRGLVVTDGSKNRLVTHVGRSHVSWSIYPLSAATFQAGWVRVPVTCRPSTAVRRRLLPSSIAPWPSSSLCWHQNLCRSPNKHSVWGQKFPNLWSKNMEQSAVCTQAVWL